MGIGIAALVVIIALIVVKNIISFGLKIAVFLILAVALAVTVFVCVQQPDMHKPFSMETIEYFLKFNKDGSMTTTKQVTHTVYKEQTK